MHADVRDLKQFACSARRKDFYIGPQINLFSKASLMAKAAPPKPLTKTQIVANIAEQTGLSKKEVCDVFDSLSNEIANSLGNKGAGQFTIPSLCKISIKDVPAKPKRKGRNRTVFSGYGLRAA